jgi:hypothetical protein
LRYTALALALIDPIAGEIPRERPQPHPLLFSQDSMIGLSSRVVVWYAEGMKTVLVLTMFLAWISLFVRGIMIEDLYLMIVSVIGIIVLIWGDGD